MIDRKKVLLSLVVLAILIASIAMMVGNRVSGASVHAQQASANDGTSSTDYQVPQGGDAWGTAFDSQGHVWVALPGCDLAPQCSSTFPGKITEFDPATKSWLNTYSLPNGYGQPIFLAFDPQGMLWFTMPMSNSIGMLNPTNGTTQQFAVPTSAAGPWGITVTSKGIVWFAEHYTNKIGSFNPTTHTFHEIATAAANSVPYGITVDSSDNVWFTENNPSAPAVAEYTAGGSLREFPMTPNGSNLTPHMITVDTNGNIWWSEGWVGAIGELKVALASPGTSNGITQYSYHLNGTHTSGISVDSSGKIWFDDSIQSIYGSFPESGNGAFSIYTTPSQNSHPHDGLNVDKQNRIWFNEQYINKLALATQSGGTTTPTPTAPTSTPAPGQVVAKDTFQRANQAHWGTASDGQAWGGDSSSVNAFAITGNAGVVSNGGSSSYSAVLGSSIADVEVLVSGSLSSYANANFGAVLRWTDGNDWYKAYIDGGVFYIQKKVAGTATVLTSTPFTAKASTAYTIRFQAFGSTLNAKVWATGSAEPTGWMLTTPDTSLTAGYAGVRVLTQAGTATFTSFQATALSTQSGGGTPTMTPTIGTTPTVGTSPTVTATPTSGQKLGTDTFQRANQALWGTASDGQAWGGDANTYNNFSIANNTGVVTNSGNNIYSAVLGPSTTDAEVVVSGSLSSYANANFGAVLRWTDANNWYKAYVSGSTFYIQRKIAGNATFIASAPFTANANTSYTIRFRVVGPTLSAKVWATGSTEPSAWTLTTSDSSLASGYCGIRAQTQSGTATFTSFQATTA